MRIITGEIWPAVQNVATGEGYACRPGQNHRYFPVQLPLHCRFVKTGGAGLPGNGRCYKSKQYLDNTFYHHGLANSTHHAIVRVPAERRSIALTLLSIW